MAEFRRAALLIVAMLAGLAPAAAHNFPTRPVNMVIPFPAGGNTDLMGRALQEPLRKALDQPVVVINKGGAAGTSASPTSSHRPRRLHYGPDAEQSADGPTAPQKPPFTMESFRYICLTYYAPYVLMAASEAPFKTAQELIAFAKAKPQNLVYGHPGPGSQPHLGMLAVLDALGVEGLGVPFQGAGPMAHAMLSTS